MRALRWTILIVLFIGVYGRVCFAADIGSDTEVTRFDTKQIIEQGDRVAGFAALDAGFLLGGVTVTGTWDSFFPVSGVLDFNFGTLDLNQDLLIQNVSSIGNWGNINGNGHVMDLSSSVHCLPTESIEDLCSITFTFETVEATSVNSVDFSFDSNYLVFGTDAGGADELFVDEVIDEGSLTVRDSVNFTQDIFGVAWHPSQDFIAVATEAGVADELFTYSFDRGGNTLTLLDSVDLGGVGNSANAVAWHPDGDHLAVASDSNTQELIVYEVDGTTGSFGASVTVNLSFNATTVDWDADGDFLVVGTDGGGGWDELRVYSFTKAPLALTLNASEDTGAVNSVSWNKRAAANGEIVVGLQGGTNRIRVYRHNSGAGTLTLVSGNAGTAINSVAWSPCCNCIASGLQNNAEGTGGELRMYSFIDDALNQEDDQEIGDNVLTVAWSHDGRVLATGDDGLGAADPMVSLYRFDAAFISIDTVTFDNLAMVLEGNTVFDLTSIIFTGESLIEGEGNIMSFSATFTLIVGSNSSLIIKDVMLAGIGQKNLQLTDHTSTISFQNTHLFLSDDFMFDKGHFEVLGLCTISGDHLFIYQSSEVSKVLSRPPQVAGIGECISGFIGELNLDAGVTFSYDSVISSTLIELEDEHASFNLNNATLAATTSLQLTKGVFGVDGRSSLESADGIIFGNGIEADNLIFSPTPAAVLQVVSGKLINRNI